MNAKNTSKADKQRVHSIVCAALKRGTLIRPDECGRCGATQCRPLDGHHADYERPLDVEWLCHSCHRKEHASHALRTEIGLAKRAHNREVRRRRMEKVRLWYAAMQQEPKMRRWAI